MVRLFAGAPRVSTNVPPNWLVQEQHAGREEQQRQGAGFGHVVRENDVEGVIQVLSRPQSAEPVEAVRQIRPAGILRQRLVYISA